MYNVDNDYELLYLISENDEDAYNKICNKYNQSIKNAARKLYNKTKYIGCSVDDIYLAGLYGFNVAIKNYNEKEEVLFGTCAMSFVKKEMISFIRNQARNKHNMLSDCLSLNFEIDESGKTVEDFMYDEKLSMVDYDNNESLKKIIDFKYKLPFLYALVYELRLNNFTNNEIILLLKIKYKTLDNAMRYIKDKLRKELNLIELF